MSAKQPESAYQRIIRAAAEGRGIRLTASECWSLSHDDAIETVAFADFEAQGVEPPQRQYLRAGAAT